MIAKCKVGLVLEGGGMRGAFTAGCLIIFWIKTCLFILVSGCLQEHATPAASCQSRGGGDLKPIRIIWRMRLTAVSKIL